MPYAENRGQRIHYEVAGDGPLVVLQHGFLMNEASWRECGFVDGLTDRFMVATVDSLGHGESDKPEDPNRYRIEERAGDIVAVIDALGADRAHVMGYSMGGWMSCGVAQHYPERLASLVIGGWDCVDGMAAAIGSTRIEFDAFLDMAKEAAPELTEWVTGALAKALDPCYVQLYDTEGSERAVLDLDVPVLLWNGMEDPYHEPMLDFARRHGFQYLATEGDHIAAKMNGAPQVLPTLRRFLSGA